MPLPDWARAFGGPLITAVIRGRPEDFQVTERLAWAFSGEGEHDYLWVEKTDANTEWVARQLARHADVPAKDVGYAGLKDRRAVTRQWFSVPRWNNPDWEALEVAGVAVRDVQRHHRKLRRGAHELNEFQIVLRGQGFADHGAELTDRIAAIGAQGVPNYFGEQRFGRDGGNLRLADEWAAAVGAGPARDRFPRHKRSLAISAIRSYLFNEMLDARVREGTWDRLVPGDKANLDGSGSVFEPELPDREIDRRCREQDIHPAGELAGSGSVGTRGDWLEALDRVRVEKGTRSLRLRVIEPLVEISDETLELSFSLRPGSYATAVLRELATVTLPA